MITFKCAKCHLDFTKSEDNCHQEKFNWCEQGFCAFPMIAYSAKCPNCYNECTEYRDKPKKERKINKYTVVVYQKTTVEVYANSESEAEDKAIEEVFESGTVDSVKTEICEIETTVNR